MIINRFLFGFRFVLIGLNAFKSIARIKRWVILPFVIDIAIFVVGVFYGTHAIHALIQQAQAHFFAGIDSIWVNGLAWLVQFLFWLLFFIFYLYFTYLVASIIGSPFYTIVADKVLASRALERHESYKIRRGLKHSIQMLVTTLVRALFLSIIAVMLFCASIMPGANFIAAFVAFILVAFDMSDYALELKGYHLKQRFQFLAKNLPEYCGMGAFIGLTAFVPGLILLCVPFGVIGATIVVDQITSAAIKRENV